MNKATRINQKRENIYTYLKYTLKFDKIPFTAFGIIKTKRIIFHFRLVWYFVSVVLWQEFTTFSITSSFFLEIGKLPPKLVWTVVINRFHIAATIEKDSVYDSFFHAQKAEICFRHKCLLHIYKIHIYIPFSQETINLKTLCMDWFYSICVVNFLCI